ncbi:MAG: hypothetical protein KJO33_12485 [Gammaproteobacteria bacterium]|nr:hypothetical protein [Gammaproteobacteria bacterium]
MNPELKETHNTVFQPSVPQPMHISQRAFLMGIRSEDYSTIEAFTDAVEARSSTVLLSPARPFIEDVGFLSFHSALSVHPGRDSAILRSEDEAKAYLILNVSKGRNYLVEFVVKSFQDSVYRLAAESDEREIEDPGGALNHVIAIVTAEGTGVAHVSLSQSVGHSFELFGVQVTSFEP